MVLLFGGVVVAASWAAFHSVPMLMLGVVINIAATYSAVRRVRARRRHSAPIEKYLAEISAGSVSEDTRQEFKDWARRVTEAAMRRYEEAPTKMRADAEKLDLE